MPTLMFSFPSGAYLGLWTGIVLFVIAGFALFGDRTADRVKSLVTVILISTLLTFGSLGVTTLKDFARTPEWAIGLLGLAIFGALGMTARHAGERQWIHTSAYFTLMSICGAAFSEAGLFGFYADPWALANSICWIVAGITTLTTIAMTVRGLLRTHRRFSHSRAHLNA